MSSSDFARRLSRSSGSYSSGHRSSRVEKPKSNHNSPRPLERRKTTSSAKRYATLDDHFNLMFGITTQDDAPTDSTESTRPVSWHPSSLSQGSSRPSASAWPTSGADWSRHSTHGADFYSLSARSPMDSMPSNYYSVYPPSEDLYRASQGSIDGWHSHPQSYAASSFSTPSTEPLPWYVKEWTRRNQAVPSPSVDYEPTDFLPIQHPSAVEAPADEEEDSGKELVGMGLYDSPDPTFSWNSPAPATGKGLKLEETWEPPEEEEDDGDDNEAGDASSDDGSIEELPVAKEEPQLPIPTVKPDLAANMQGQSFFFEDDDNSGRDWWCQQQPSVPVQATGLQYNVAWI
ncbi:uncharacterized protein EI97DRAFT_384303 [Westerdykella ornata]|uniref:Uncharacterized protein n=1 Tax=Westerdykella ornata TaxID=318751 RepID=A0A6A6JD88_WESOR|nr:uncharacterized protein EI97DRAFT_384303 [Westerdykella ornata]KAF2273159.1 hypothetical protein EI97DRAFT_384303 [Westerdykella ornata]